MHQPKQGSKGRRLPLGRQQNNRRTDPPDQADDVQSTSSMSSGNETDPLLGDKLDWMLIVTTSFNYFKWALMYVSFIPLLPFYANAFGLNAWQQSLLVATMQLGWLIGFPVLHSGLLRTRHILYIGGSMYVIAPLIMGLATHAWMLFVARVLEGFGSCLLMNTCDAILARQCAPSMRGRTFGIQKAIGMSGLVYGPLASGVLLELGGLMLIFGIISFIGMLGMALYYMAPEAWLASRDEKVMNSARTRFQHIFHSADVAALILLQCFTFIMTGVFWVAMPQLLEGPLKFTALAVSLCWMGWDVFKFLCSLIGGWLADRVGGWFVVIFSLAVVGISSISLGALVSATSMSDRYIAVIVAAGIMASMGGSGGGLAGPAFPKLFVDIEKYMGKGNYEEILTLSYLTITISIATGNIYAGYVISYLGFTLTFVCFGTLELVVLVICGILTRKLAHLGDSDEEVGLKDAPEPTFNRVRRPSIE